MDGRSAEEVGGRYRRMRLTSVHEGTVLSKQMGMNIATPTASHMMSEG